MFRRAFTMGAVLVGAMVWLAPAWGDEDPRTAAQFIQGLRDRGYYDIASEYLEALRNEPDMPADLRATVDYEQGRMFLEEASRTGDLVRQKELLDKAGAKLGEFSSKNPNHPKAPEASVLRASLLVERGHLALIQSQELEEKDKAGKAAKLAEARAALDQARTEYEKAETQLAAAHKKYPPYLPDNDPRKEERDRLQATLIDAQLKKAVVDYEEGETYEPKSKQREDYMAKALAQFEELYKKYRLMAVGPAARMWQGKCYEERGEIGPALGIYKELLEHADRRLRPLQRHVMYFKIIAEAKRGEYALAADDANRWRNEFNATADRRSFVGLGVTLEWAKNLLALANTAADEAEKKAKIARAVELASEVVRIPSPHKPEALAILKKYKPSRAAAAAEIARLTYDEAFNQGDQAIGEKDFKAGIACFKQAIRRADPLKDPDKANQARFQLAYCYLKNNEPYEAFVLYDHIARRYPRFGVASKAGYIGISALVDAYNLYLQTDRESDLHAIMDLAEYTASTWPDTEDSDSALLVLGQINTGYGKYDKAYAAFETIRPQSPKWAEAQTRAGRAHWMMSELLRRSGSSETTRADAEVAKAMDCLNKALKARREAGTQDTDPDLIENACYIAEIQLNNGKATDALALLAPLAKAQPTPVNTLSYRQLMANMLRAHVLANQVDLALTDMANIEKAGVGGDRQVTHLYVELGKKLEDEMKSRKAKGDTAGLNRTRDAYTRFLTALAGRKTGQTFESLAWVGDNMLKIGQPEAATKVFEQILNPDSPKEVKAGTKDQLLLVNLRLAAAYRDSRNFKQADKLVADLLKDHPKTLEVQVEKGMLLEARALAKQGPWGAALAQWQFLGKLLSRARTKSTEYYDAWWHVAFGYWKDGKPDLAKQTLSSIMRLSPAVGGPDMKKKYQDLLAQIK